MCECVWVSGAREGHPWTGISGETEPCSLVACAALFHCVCLCLPLRVLPRITCVSLLFVRLSPCQLVVSASIAALLACLFCVVWVCGCLSLSLSLSLCPCYGCLRVHVAACLCPPLLAGFFCGSLCVSLSLFLSLCLPVHTCVCVCV